MKTVMRTPGAQLAQKLANRFLHSTGQKATIAAEIDRLIERERRACARVAIEAWKAEENSIDASTMALKIRNGIQARGLARKTAKKRAEPTECLACGCPGSCDCPCNGCRARQMMATRGT